MYYSYFLLLIYLFYKKQVLSFFLSFVQGLAKKKKKINDPCENTYFLNSPPLI